MPIQLSLQTNTEAEGYGLTFLASVEDSVAEEILRVTHPVTVETLAPNAQGAKAVYSSAYDSVDVGADSVTGEKVIALGEAQRYRLVDVWRRVEPDTWLVDRRLNVEHGTPGWGVSLRLDVVT